MKKIALALFAVACLTVPAVAGSSVVADKPTVLAQGVQIGVDGVRIGDRDRDARRDRDMDRHHRDRDVIVVKPRHRDHDGDRAHD
jgi:hypothetical protein